MRSIADEPVVQELRISGYGDNLPVNGLLSTAPVISVNSGHRVDSPPTTWSSIVPTADVAGVLFSNVSRAEAVRLLEVMSRRKNESHLVVTGNLDHMYRLSYDADFREIYKSASLVLCDGMPVLWLSKLFKTNCSLHHRVTGVDLVSELCKVSQSTGSRIFLLGGLPGSAEKTRDALCLKYPGCVICGTYCPDAATFGTEGEQERICEAIQAVKPHFLLVALGAPKQERWIAANSHRLGVPVSIGVGGAFEICGGSVRRAPNVIQNLGFEWLFRLVHNPRRLWKRYIQVDLPFLLRLIILCSMRCSIVAP